MGLKVVRSSERAVKPWEETPSETLELSGIDKLPVLRCNARTLHVYKHKEDVNNDKLFVCEVMREAVSKALVSYYPLAGRLVDDSSSVECNAQGVWFVDAYADCTLSSVLSELEEIDQLLLPPPLERHYLIEMQVTRFSCGGFILGLVFSHTVCDGLGAAQFLNAVGEVARGLPGLSVEPVWGRDFFSGACAMPMPPMPVSMLGEDMKLEGTKVEISRDEVERAKRKFHEETRLRCSTFEVVAGALWRCRCRAVMGDSHVSTLKMKLVFFANCRRLVEPPLPSGFYGNCFFPVRVTSSSLELSEGSMSHVIGAIQKAKASLPVEFAEEYMKGGKAGEFMSAPSYETMYVSEWGRLGFEHVDFGWGPPTEVVPIKGHPLIPAAVITHGRNSITLNTWCVRPPHLQTFLHCLSQLFA